MVTYMTTPKTKLTLDTTDYENLIESAKITRIENGFDIATIVLPDTTYYPTAVTESTPIQLAVKDASSGTWTTILKGIVRFPIAEITPEKRSLTLSCLGAGYGLGEMLVGNEYGVQTAVGMEDPATIAANIITSYVNTGMAVWSSLYAYTALVNDIAGDVPYIDFPYKPANACMNDLCDLMTAINYDDPGPHWIVTTDDVFRMKPVGGTQAGWTKYVEGATNTGQATLTYSVDYTKINLEKLAPEANYVFYYGTWRRPSNGDYWTEDTASLWDSPASDAPVDDATNHAVGSKSLRIGDGTDNTAWYPAGQDAALNFGAFQQFSVPLLNFYVLKHGTPTNVAVRLYTTYNAVTNFYTYLLHPKMTNDDVWYHFELPTGPYYKTAQPDFEWTSSGAPPDWGEINMIWFGCSGVGAYICVDGLYVGDVPICRQAYNSDLPGGTMKMRLVVDNIGKDDSLVSADDSGVMAQLAKAELLRMQSTATVGTVETPLMKDALPGQLVSIQEADYRITKITHTIDGSAWLSTLDITDDLLNGRSKPRYEAVNKVYASMRPEWQDRQASSMKAGSVNWRTYRFYKDYAPV